MKKTLIDYFSRIMTLTELEKKAILEDMDISSFKKGHTLLREGQTPKASYFVLKGCVRKYLTFDGMEKTVEFFTEEQWILTTDSTDTPPQSDHYLVCMDDCELVIGTKEKGDKLFRLFPRFQEISRIILEKQISKQQMLTKSFIIDTPEDRYRKLQEQRAKLLERVPQYHLASYLGIKPESLSRIRKRLTIKNK